MADMRDRIAMHNGNKLKLGLFGSNCSSGRALTIMPERWPADWDSNEKLAEMADAAGIDFMLPIARWKGYQGETDFQGTTLETLTWATGLLALTKRMTVFATVHAPLVNPVMAAKCCVTADQVGRGRFALNIVIGWNEGEFGMFGVPQREDMNRYLFGQEWIDAVLRMWGSEEEFDFDGEFLQLKNLRLKPKPHGGTRPLMMNAGASDAGRAYALRNCDALFTSVSFPSLERTALENAAIKQRALDQGREIGVYTVGEVVCRPTRKEANDYYRYWTEEGVDWAAIDYMLHLKGLRPADDPAEYQRRRNLLVHGQSGFAIIGDPDDVAKQLGDISSAGFDGLGFSFVNFLDELPLFADEVLPRLEKMGLREKGRDTR
jgi:dimethylsulfone monooxygenase